MAKAFTAPLSTLCTASHRDRGAAQEARAREGAPAAAGGPPSAPSPAGPPLPSPAELRTWPLDNKFVFLGVETGFHACRAAKWMILLCTLALGATPELRGMSTLVGKFAICLQLHLGAKRSRDGEALGKDGVLRPGPTPSWDFRASSGPGGMEGVFGPRPPEHQQQGGQECLVGLGTGGTALPAPTHVRFMA